MRLTGVAQMFGFPNGWPMLSQDLFKSILLFLSWSSSAPGPCVSHSSALVVGSLIGILITWPTCYESFFCKLNGWHRPHLLFWLLVCDFVSSCHIHNFPQTFHFACTNFALHCLVEGTDEIHEFKVYICLSVTSLLSLRCFCETGNRSSAYW